MIHELKTPLWVETPKGAALARFLIYEGVDHDVLFLCEMEANGAYWMWRAPEVRGQRNFTLGFGRPFPAPVARREFDAAHRANPERP